MTALAAVVGWGALAALVAVPTAQAATQTASDPNVLNITGNTKAGSTATVVVNLGSPKGVTLAFGYFKQALRRHLAGC